MKRDITTPEATEFTKEVLDFIRKKLSDLQEETGDLFNLEATPAEGTSYRLAKIDKEKFGDEIVSAGIIDPYYTNSTQLPVGFTTDIFTALDYQDEIQSKYTGGTVFHGYIGEEIDPEACKALVKKIAYNYRLPYYTVTPTFSVCNDHGYLRGEHFHCPQCGSEAEVYTRIVGYYRPVQNWNKGKKEEYKERTEFVSDGTPLEIAAPSLAINAQLGASVNANTVSKKTKIQAYKFFYSDTCPNCPPVKDYITKLEVAGEIYNASTREGLQEAQKYNIFSVPTVLLMDNQNNILSEVHSRAELEQCWA